jgi:hypothetical protein
MATEGVELLEDLPRRIRRNLDCEYTKMGDRELEIMIEPVLEYLDNRDMGSKPPLRATELYEQWLNGNKKDVMRAITCMSSMRAACVTAFMMVLLMEGDDKSKAESFIAAMQERLG